MLKWIVWNRTVFDIKTAFIWTVLTLTVWKQKTLLMLSVLRPDMNIKFKLTSVN